MEFGYLNIKKLKLCKNNTSISDLKKVFDTVKVLFRIRDMWIKIMVEMAIANQLHAYSLAIPIFLIKKILNAQII